ncbi:MAG: hypothetical protein JNL36_01400 [Candidatus Kapabacteria bacterium]|nr:hypothetical protein [Candidatus Kapabacteria bacterium]
MNTEHKDIEKYFLEIEEKLQNSTVPSYEVLENLLSIEHSSVLSKIHKNTEKFTYFLSISNYLIGYYYFLHSHYGKCLEYCTLAQNSLPISDSYYTRCSVFIGRSYSKIGELEKALFWLDSAISYYTSHGDEIERAIVLSYIGEIHLELGDYVTSLTIQMECLHIVEKNKKFQQYYSITSKIGLLYFTMGDDDSAEKNFNEVLEYTKKIQVPSLRGETLLQLANLHLKHGKTEETRSELLEALELYRNENNKIGQAQALESLGSYYLVVREFEVSFESYSKSIDVFWDLGDRKGIARVLNQLSRLYLQTDYFEYSIEQAILHCKESLQLSEVIQALKLESESNDILAQCYERNGDFQLAYQHVLKHQSIEKIVMNDEISRKTKNIQLRHEIENKQRLMEMHQKEAEIYRLKNIELESAYSEISRQQEVLQKQATEIEIANSELHEINIQLNEANKMTDKLLLNVLPAKIAKRLLKNENPIADYFENTTVLFADLAGFTKLSSSSSPNHIVEILNTIFYEFDLLTEKYGLEKIKTIGDNYMCVGGVPDADPNHAKSIALFALDILVIIKKYAEIFQEPLSLRIGFNSGDVVAGVIGKNKFVYDLWGDTVNTASRMESYGEIHKIQVSEASYELLKNDFHFEERIPIEMKGKGFMKTYFLLGKK